ncbi:hypothetical protein Sjap_005586 [Stephania japonica]|uniref:Uncharacterized protein n=1 Tax=Stephania japonica TaxID=461633 RepID=A0AAP0K5W0_9MAGN
MALAHYLRQPLLLETTVDSFVLRQLNQNGISRIDDQPEGSNIEKIEQHIDEEEREKPLKKPKLESSAKATSGSAEGDQPILNDSLSYPIVSALLLYGCPGCHLYHWCLRTTLDV